MDQNARLEREITITSRERGVDQGCHPSYSNIYYELLQASKEAMLGVRETNQKLLVRSYGILKEGSLGQVVVFMSTKINGRYGVQRFS